MNNPDILKAGELPVVSPGPSDCMVGEQLGQLRRFPRDSFPMRPEDDARLRAVEAGQLNGIPGYATVAQLPVPLPAGSVNTALVTNDPSAANNGLWRWSAGVWVKSADRISAAEQNIALLQADTAPFNAVYGAVAEFGPYAVVSSTIAGKYVAIATGAYADHASYATYVFPVTGGEDVYVSASIVGTSTALATFFDAGGNYLGYQVQAPSGTAAVYTDKRVNVPAGAVELRVSKQTGSAYGGIPALRRRVVTPVRQRISDAVTPISSRTTAVEASVSDLGSYAVPSQPFTSGSYVRYSDGVLVAHASYGYEFHPVSAGETVYLSGSITGNTTALAVFFDAANAYVGFAERAPSGSNAVYVDKAVLVPSRAVKMALCQQIYRQSDYPVKMRRMQPVAGLAGRVASLEAKADTYWAGKTVVWFGTSIPTGNDIGGRYPQQLAAQLGFNLTSETVSGSAFRAGVRSRVTGSDPYGWAGSPWQAVLWSLAMTLAEKQYLIDNWASIAPTLGSSPPATLTQAQIDAALACSYENKLVAAHLGSNRKSVYIFDAPYNDRAMASDLTTAGSGTRDRFTYVGAMNFLIDLIVADNPKAQVFFIGHYENAKSASIADAQAALAGYWSRPLCRLWEALGWNQQTISTTGYWSNNLWVESGGPTQSITLLNRWLPDGVHPANDYSGSAVARITEALLPWLRSVR